MAGPVAPAPEASEAPSTNSNPAPTEAPAAAEQANSQQPDPHQITLTDDQLRFINANGGFDKVFEKSKTNISQPQKQQAPVQAQAQAQPQPTAQEQQPTFNTTVPKEPVAPRPEGILSPQEIAMKSYFNELAKNPEYASIADDIRSGKVLTEMKELGTSAFEPNGDLNMNRLTKFLQMYKGKQPATPPTTPEDNAPAIEYYKVPGDGKITSDEQAMKVLHQAGHPQHDEALKFMRTKLSGPARRG